MLSLDREWVVEGLVWSGCAGAVTAFGLWVVFGRGAGARRLTGLLAAGFVLGMGTFGVSDAVHRAIERIWDGRGAVAGGWLEGVVFRWQTGSWAGVSVLVGVSLVFAVVDVVGALCLRGFVRRGSGERLWTLERLLVWFWVLNVGILLGWGWLWGWFGGVAGGD